MFQDFKIDTNMKNNIQKVSRKWFLNLIYMYNSS